MTGKDYYQKHRDEIIAATKAWIEANREQHNANARAYYHRHRKERLAYAHVNIKRFTDYSRAYRQNSCVLSKGNDRYIRGVDKSPYPADNRCPFCRKVQHRSLQWHHWDDECPEIGFWVCISCHARIEALLRKAPNRSNFINYIESQLSTSQ